ncbi:Osmotically-inducible protein OsmY, contains BON domain [Bosea sp. OK403]|jgi:osmotically-inducible protein OsmY|uniref:BON domain-containing protein n=1 Tax=Bosea sp. OK403 TaxID=1855286 RepID=UPI0008E06BAF|nr:BON domain-containing protein [Bosea sp. OK403]SFI05180.1 Osmotically-inducible protein OsmY, contains BON domain [Bosea sp. OK403]
MTDKQLRLTIIDELDFEPSIEAAHIGVAVEDGVVTLTGHVQSYAEKIAAEKAVRRVKGVRAIAEEIEVRYPHDKKTSDTEIAQRALSIIAWDVTVPDAVKVKVEKGWVQLSGTVDWQYQRRAAENAIRKLSGVVGVSNLIELKQRASANDVKKAIEDALKRNAELEASTIRVTVGNDNRVTLDGKVHAWYERGVAERAAWSAPGVKSVDDHLLVA